MRVQGVQLEVRGLSGRIPSEFGNLSGLRVLSFRINRLEGTIPPELGALSELQKLDLHGNLLTGHIPLSFAKLFKLKTLDLHANELEGTIPSEMGRMFNLERLSLSGNSLTGSIPAELGDLPNLLHLQLSQNELTGTIPRELGNLSKLEVLYLWDNKLTGDIPSRLGQLQRLGSLNIYSNAFTGDIPQELANLTRLYTLDLGENQMSGEIPDWLSNLSRLDRLSLHNNKFTGPIPAGLGNLKKLRILYLNNNDLTGEIPATLGYLPAITDLHLRHNRLTGPIPPDLGNLTTLRTLLIGRNNLTGEIPEAFGQLSNLEQLYLGYGKLSGTIPASLGNLSKLEYLQLEHNELHGVVPIELAELSNLKSLLINDNQLNGVVPSELSNLTSLEELDISNSGLAGCLPWLLARNSDLSITHDGLAVCSRRALAVKEGGSVSIPIDALTYDTILEDSAIGDTRVSNIVNGMVSVEEEELVFTHDGSETSTASFTYRVSAGHLSVTDQVTIEVKPINDPPVAAPDIAVVDEGQAVSIEAETLLGNDVDPDNEDVHVTGVANAVNGSVALEGGTVTYEHDGSETNTGSFRYTISDGIEADSATVVLEVLPVNDPPLGVSDADTVVEGDVVSLPTSALVRNDVDPENDDLRITSVGEAFNGTVWLEDTTITYEHDGSETTTGGFTYTVSDGIASDSVKVALSVIPSNDPPSGVMDSLAIEEGGSISVPAASLLRNDLDPEGDVLSITSVAGAINGMVQLDRRSITYKHDGSETTTGGFTYTLTDGEFAATADVAVVVTPVNDPPIGNMDSLTVNEGGNLTVEASTLLNNDTDAENEALTIVAVGDAVNGMVFMDGTTITYEHDDSETVIGSFSYTASDGTGADTTTVEITVTPVDDVPAVTEEEATPTAATPTAATPTAATPTAATPTAATPTAATPTAAMPTAAMPTAAMPTAAMPTAAMPTAATPTSATHGPEATERQTPGSMATPSSQQDTMPEVSVPPTDDGGVNVGLIVLIIVLAAAIAGIGAIVVVRRRKRT